MPDLETPGASASVCATPRKRALRNVRSPRPWSVGSRSTRVEDDGACGEEDRDLPRLPEMALDGAAQSGTDDHGWDRGNDHDPGDALVDVPNRPRANAGPPRAYEPDDVAPEVRDYRH